MRALLLSSCVLLSACNSVSSALPTGPSSALPAATALADATNMSAASGNLNILFTKWVTTPTAAMAGVVSLNSTLGSFAGQVNARDLFDNGLAKLQATYSVTVDGITFSAEMDGQQNQHGRGVLNGVVTTGSYVGARVHAEFQATPANECASTSEVLGGQGGINGFCYIGVIRVMTKSAH
jgi:hypothetical protein